MFIYLFFLFISTSYNSKYLSRRSMRNNLAGPLKIRIFLARNDAFCGMMRMIWFLQEQWFDYFKVRFFQMWIHPRHSPHTLLSPSLPYDRFTGCNQGVLKCKHLYLSFGTNGVILLPPVIGDASYLELRVIYLFTHKDTL